MELDGKFVFSELLEQKPKTSVYVIKNKDSREAIGLVKWYGSWRRYTYQPFCDTVYEQTCMREISDFIDRLMEERKQ